MADAQTEPLRRIPVQERSARRVQRMLDVCAELLPEVGYDGLSTSLIADRAGVAIGSVYQFFPDKRALVQALTLRNLGLFMERVQGLFVAQEFAHWWEAVDAVMDEFVLMHRTVPGFGFLHFGDVVDVHILDADQDNNAVLAGRMRALLVERFGLVDDERLALGIAVAVEATDAVLKLAFRIDPDGDPAVIGEAKQMIRTYLSNHLPE
jgi:AcrR family transcriptional regulator